MNYLITRQIKINREKYTPITSPPIGVNFPVSNLLLRMIKVFKELTGMHKVRVYLLKV